MRMRQWSARAPVALLALAATACGGNPTSSTSSYVTQLVSPNPVVATASTDGAHQYTASFTVTLTEQGGVGVALRDINVVTYEVTGGAATTVLDAAHASVAVNVPTARIEANQTLALGFELDYTLPTGGRAALAVISLAFVDDKGNAYSGNIQVNIS